jgi:hypothetical protein
MSGAVQNGALRAPQAAEAANAARRQSGAPSLRMRPPALAGETRQRFAVQR